MGRSFVERLFLWVDDMSRSLGVLTLDLIARTGGFEQGMDRASRRVRTTAQDMEAAKRTADRYIMAIGAAGVAFAGAAAAMAVQSAKAMDATAKMAQQIGTTTEALTGMRFATQQFANISDQQFDQAMRRMTRRIAEAAEGSGSAKNALDAMGLSARELARLSPDRQMLAIADAMQRTERQADRLRHTMAIFDTEGMALVPALQQGAEAFEQNIELARRFGVVVSTEAAQAAEQFTTNMNLLTKGQEGFRNQLAEAVLPMLADFSGYLVEIAQRIGPMGEAIEKALKAAGVAALATATIFTSRLIASIAKTGAAWLAATASAARYQMQMSALASAITGTNRALTASTAALAGSMTVMSRAGQLALGVLGGPVGLLVTVGLTAAAFLTMGRDAKTAAVDVDELAESLNTLNQRQLESAAFNLENELGDLSKQAEGHGQILRTLNADYEALAERYGENYEGLRNVRQAIRDEEEALEAVTKAIAKKSPLLAQIVQRLQEMAGAASGAAVAQGELNDAMAGFSGETGDYLKRLQDRTAAMQDGNSAVKQAERYLAGLTGVSEAYRTAVMSQAHAQDAIRAAQERAAKSTSAATKTLTEAQRAAQNFRREQENSLKAQYREISALNDQAKALDQQISLYGLAESAKYDLAIADLERERAAIAIMDRESEEIAIIERKIELLNQMKGSQQTLERLDAEKQAWESWSRDVEQIFDQVGQSLTDAIFDGGKSGLDLLKDWAKTLTLRIFVQPVMSGLQAMVTGVGPGGIAAGGSAAGGMMGSPTSLFSMFGGNSMGMGMSNVMSHLSTSSMLQGTGVGNWLMGQAGNVAGMSNLALGGAGLLGGLGANLIFGGKGHSGIGGGLGSTLGMALGGPLGAVAGTLLGGGLGSLFGDREPTTRREQRTQVEFAGGLFDVTKRDDRAPAGADAAARALAEQAVSTANDIFKQVGVDAAIDSFHAIMASSYAGDRDGVASGGQLRLGDELRKFGIAVDDENPTIQGFGGWSSADTLPRLATDIQLSVLEAFQSVGDELPGVLSSMLEGIDVRGLGEAEAQALAERFTLLTQGAAQFLAAIETMPFAELRDLSFDAAAGLIQFAGGLEQLTAGMDVYYQHFFSDQERFDFAAQQMNAAFSDLGLTMPDVTQGADSAKAAYRDLVESLDLTTESGQQARATMMMLAGSFHELVTGLDQVAQAARNVTSTPIEVANAQYDAAISQLQAAYSAVQRFAQAEIARLQQTFERTDSAMGAYRTQVQRLESELGGLLTTLSRGVADLRGQVDATARMQYDQARAVISTALVTGQLPQTADLTEAMRIAQQGVAGGRYASAFDQRAAYLTLANELEALQGIAKPELDTALASLEQLEKQYNQLRGLTSLGESSLTELHKQVAIAMADEQHARVQIAAVEAQLSWAERQYNALMGIGSGITDLDSAMRAMSAAISAVQRASETAGAKGWEQRYLEAKQADLEAGRHRPDDYTGTTTEALRRYIAASVGLTPYEHYLRFGQYEGIPGFDVGTNYVPYDMTANIHKGEIIIDPRSSDILRRYGIGVQGGGNREVVAELRQLRAEVSALRSEQKSSQFAIAKYTQKTARIQEKWDAIGMPQDQAEVTA